jgi:hypothetical protein
MKRHRSIEMADLCLKWNINVVFGKLVKGEKRKKNEKAPKDSPFKK